MKVVYNNKYPDTRDRRLGDHLGAQDRRTPT